MHRFPVERIKIERFFGKEKMNQRLASADYERNTRMRKTYAVANGSGHQLFTAFE